MNSGSKVKNRNSIAIKLTFAVTFFLSMQLIHEIVSVPEDRLTIGDDSPQAYLKDGAMAGRPVEAVFLFLNE